MDRCTSVDRGGEIKVGEIGVGDKTETGVSK